MKTSGAQEAGATSCAEPERQPERPSHLPEAAGPRVLLVEDNDLLRVLFGVILGQAGYDVVSVADGGSALSEMDDAVTPIAALVTDVDLGAAPTGWSVALAARERWPTCHVLYLTGAGTDARSLRGVPNGIFLSKPFEVARMAEVLKTLVHDAATS